ncbi:MAG TPA: hypothetical protein VGS97_14620, partial [Actinocrinis sp.]
GNVRLNLGAAFPGISAAMLNLTVVNATGGGYLTAYPDGENAPTVSNLNYPAGRMLANEAVVRVGADGYDDTANVGAGAANLVVDIPGYFTAGSGAKFVPITPTRYLATRTGQDEVYGGFDTIKKSGPGFQTDLDVGGLLEGVAIPVPAPTDGSATMATAANVTITLPTAEGCITVYPGERRDSHRFRAELHHGPDDTERRYRQAGSDVRVQRVRPHTTAVRLHPVDRGRIRLLQRLTLRRPSALPSVLGDGRALGLFPASRGRAARSRTAETVSRPGGQSAW